MRNKTSKKNNKANTTQSFVQHKLLDYNILYVLAVLCATIFITLPSVSSLPLPVEYPTKSGDPVFVQTSSDLIGDIGSYASAVFVDIDNDEDYDMFVGRDNGLLRYYENTGNQTSPIWTYQNNNMIPDNGDWSKPSFTDFDKDGDYDLFVGYSDGYIRYYTNTGTKEVPTFVHTQAIIDIGGHAAPAAVDYNLDRNIDLYYGRDNRYIYKIKNDVDDSGFIFDDFVMGDFGTDTTVAFVDIDNDNDYDAYVGRDAGYIYFLENIGDNTEAEWADAIYQFDVGSSSSPTFADLDDDNDMDMVVGVSDGTMVYYRNDGTINTPFFTEVPGFFTIDIGDRAAPTFADIDNDGDLDLAIGTIAGIVQYYENQGTPSVPNFILSSTGLIGDVGDYSKPVFVDLDNDADMDLAVGRSIGDVLFYENTGTVSSYNFIANGTVLPDWYDYSAPAFADLDNDNDLDLATGSGDSEGWIAISENVGSASQYQFSNNKSYWMNNLGRGYTPDFYDMDSDGDYDMIVGAEDGYVRYYRNDGNSNKPIWKYQRNYIGDYGSWTNPNWVDLNKDGDMDFVLGRSDEGIIRYFENDVANSGFDFTTVNSNLIGDYNDRSIPTTGDLDNDGDYDLLVGYYDGIIRYFENNGTPESPNFVFNRTLFDIGNYAAPSLGDMDNDGDLDMVLGRSTNGYLLYYENVGDATTFNFTQVSTNYLNSYVIPTSSGNSDYAIPNIVDYDNDGDLDLIIGVDMGTTRYWRNDGTAVIASFSDKGDIIGDISNNAAPGVGDLDGDGDYDIILGRENDGQIRYYRNQGTPEAASLINVYAGDSGIQFIPSVGSIATFDIVDLDNDGLNDIIAGRSDGLISFIKNNGLYDTPQEKGDYPTWVLRDSNLLDSYCRPGDSNGWITVDMEDMDDDGDLDLVCANYYNSARYWENVGTDLVYSFMDRGNIASDLQESYDISLVDLDNDEDFDLFMGEINGRTFMYKNTGDKTSPIWTYVYRKSLGYDYLLDYGTYSRMGFVDIDNDGLLDVAMTHVAGNNVGEFRILKNKGLPQSPEEKASNPTWIQEGWFYDMTNSYNVPTIGDIDGDGDHDMLIGNYYNYVVYIENIGYSGNDQYLYKQTLYDYGYNYAAPSLVDIDGDGDLDFSAGYDQGYLYMFENQGLYRTVTTVIVRNETGGYVANAQVTFEDGTGPVCINLTDIEGKAECVIPYSGDSGKIIVNNAQAGTTTLVIQSPNSNGKSSITLDTPFNNFAFDIERFIFNTYSIDNVPEPMQLKVADEGKTLFTGYTDETGFIDGFFPKKYLVNKQEPYSQNRIMYDVTLTKNDDYASDLELNDIFVPNEINFNSNVESQKMYKLMSTHEMSTDAKYKGYVIFPALQAQKEYEFSDTVPANFTYDGNVIVEYMGQDICQVDTLEASAISIDMNTPGCIDLGSPVMTTGDWLKFEFTVKSPTLDMFIIEGFTENNYVFPSAQIDLVS